MIDRRQQMKDNAVRENEGEYEGRKYKWNYRKQKEAK